MATTSSISFSAEPGPTASESGGLPLTTTSPEAAACYRQAIEALLGAEAGVVELLDEALAHDPAFALAHTARWMEAHGAGDTAAARIAREAAMASLDGVTSWERAHVECIGALLQREPDARTKANEHLGKHPHDLVVVSQLIGDLFFHGGDGKRQAVMDVLRPLAPHYRDDWAFLARLGFHMSELGEPEAALEIIDRALEVQPHAPFVAHAKAHALLEAGRRAESHRFLLEWTASYDPAGPIDGHIQWHLSLGELEHGEPEAAIERYVRSSAPGASQCAAGLLLADAGGLFFRMALDGTSLQGMPRAELYDLLVKLRRALKIPFVAVHAAALAVALGDDNGSGYLEAMDSGVTSDAAAPGALVVSALGAYLAGDLRACVDALERDRASMWEAIGGSNEERALMARLYAKASADVVRK